MKISEFFKQLFIFLDFREEVKKGAISLLSPISIAIISWLNFKKPFELGVLRLECLYLLCVINVN